MGFFRISTIPDNLVGENIAEAIGNNSFALLYDLIMHHTYLWLEEGREALTASLSASIPGFQTEMTTPEIEPNCSNVKALSFYRGEEEDEKEIIRDPLHDLFTLNNSPRFVSLAFINVRGEEAGRAKRYAESLLSSKELRETRSTSHGLRGVLGSSAVHRELYKDSEELIITKSILNSINEAILKNNLLYKAFLIYDSKSATLEQYLKNRLAILLEKSIQADSFSSLIKKLSKERAFPFGTTYCSKFIRVYGARQVRTVSTAYVPDVQDGIPMGKLMREGVSETMTEICISLPTFNLGFLITGLPGSGKTMEAMHVVDRAISTSRRPSFVIAPSEEWSGFGIEHGMNLIRLFSDSIPINFFRCPSVANKEKFCQDLAIVLSSAAGAGPYRRPMEKCMLNAFRIAYHDTTNPDPVDVYEEIVESVIRLHGKRTNAGIKYTKHGENIKASLESLKIILNSPNYSTKNSIKFEELLTGGAVFDTSGASTATRSFLYALILNQLYAITSGFDTNGDSDLRMLICIEEAQIIFKDETSPAVEDLKQRIQDFRKRGIGLMLLAHNISDIDLGIRRLCQTRLYMKQSPDSAFLAARELIFPCIDNNKVIEKLKLLDSRVGALSFITRRGKEKVQEESVLIKTEAYDIAQKDLHIEKIGHSNDFIKTEFKLTLGDRFDGSRSSVEVKFLGETMFRFTLIKETSYVDLVQGRKYTLCLTNDKGKIVTSIPIIAKPEINLFVGEGKFMEIISSD
jgi:hypothetical protein